MFSPPYFIRVYLILIFLFVSAGTFAQTGQVYQSLVLESKILNQSVKYSIYLPPGYEKGLERYPVIYLLHGRGDNETAWIQKGKVNVAADLAIQKKEITPPIIIMPYAGTTYYVNDFKGEGRYEEMFVQELMPFMERKYRIKAEKKYRGVAGLSMGGFGALLYALKYPGLFNACAAFSAAVRTDEEILKLDAAAYENRFGHLADSQLKGEARLTPYYRQHSILDLTQNIPAAELKKVNYYLDCGDDDHLTVGNALLHVQLTRLGVPHQYRSRDGGHDWNYWRTNITEGLKFISQFYK